MLTYQVKIKVDAAIENQWLHWMKSMRLQILNDYLRKYNIQNEKRFLRLQHCPSLRRQHSQIYFLEKHN